MIPPALRYTKDHEWISVDGDRGRIGITAFAQEQLGDVVFVELPEVGRTFAQGEQFGSIESVKAVSDLYCPVSGEVVDVNAAAAEQPEQVNQASVRDLAHRGPAGQTGRAVVSARRRRLW